jgi:membrane associated rhomboid family serine protease
MTQVPVELFLPLAGGGAAWRAHVGGFIAGLVLIPFFQRRTRNTACTPPTKTPSHRSVGRR